MGLGPREEDGLLYQRGRGLPRPEDIRQEEAKEPARGSPFLDKQETANRGNIPCAKPTRSIATEEVKVLASNARLTKPIRRTPYEWLWVGRGSVTRQDEHSEALPWNEGAG
jgi:hypothetical protein